MYKFSYKVLWDVVNTLKRLPDQYAKAYNSECYDGYYNQLTDYEYELVEKYLHK